MLRLSELYPSVQGEGQRVGTLTQFVRFAGCNMRCPGWPCDTPHAIDPEIWRHEAEKITPVHLAERISILADDMGCRNICFTGGEPFIQPLIDLEELVDRVQADEYGDSFLFEAFSNGSVIYPKWVLDKFHITMDWKLEGSGEAKTQRAARLANAVDLKSSDDIKFVVKDTKDLHEAMAISILLQNHGVQAGFLVGTAWSTISEADIVHFMMEQGVPWRLNVQVHKYIYPAEQRGV